MDMLLNFGKTFTKPNLLNRSLTNWKRTFYMNLPFYFTFNFSTVSIDDFELVFV